MTSDHDAPLPGGPFIGYVLDERRFELYSEQAASDVDWHHSHLVKDMDAYDAEPSLRFVRMNGEANFTINGRAVIDPGAEASLKQLRLLADILIRAGADHRACLVVEDLHLPRVQAPYQGKNIGSLSRYATPASEARPSDLQKTRLYHRTRHEFATFDISRANANNEHGPAIYLSDRESSGRHYGDRVVVCDLAGAALDEDQRPQIDLVHDLCDQLAQMGYEVASGRALRSSTTGIALEEIRQQLGDLAAGNHAINIALERLGYVARRYREEDGTLSFAVFAPAAITVVTPEANRAPLIGAGQTWYHWGDLPIAAVEVHGEGLHFGTYEAALDRARSRGHTSIDYQVEEDADGHWVWADSGPLAGDGQGPFASDAAAQRFISEQPTRIEPIAFKLSLRNPIELPDLGKWGAWDIIRHLPPDTLSAEERERVMSADDRHHALRKALLSKGIDGIVYRNLIESPGSISVIVFSADQIVRADPAPIPAKSPSSGPSMP